MESQLEGHIVGMTNTPEQTYSAPKNRFKQIRILRGMTTELLEVWQSRVSLEPMLKSYFVGMINTPKQTYSTPKNWFKQYRTACCMKRELLLKVWQSFVNPDLLQGMGYKPSICSAFLNKPFILHHYSLHYCRP
ncbi:hypothetical protein CWB99_23180 [Pseudoalteromonas rubra]|uniref:Uncharacterized protein n=1 Tax=Pseudoalteromonas rubra TaxID=43658 RepID=A0A5S3WGB1_9GAMM|nr:hypothetical protein [Pseudoalteromonas rubra]TMP23489.1 hypothetical protein CWB99_23180 [Pseudoalteromonas rubra]